MDKLNTYKTASEVYGKLLPRMLRKKKGEIKGDVPSGLAELDRRFDGFFNGEPIVIAGRPAMGKTAFCVSLIKNIAVQRQIPIGIFSFGESAEFLTEKIIASIDKGEDMNFVNSPVYISDSQFISLKDIEQQACKMKLEGNVRMIIIDSLQQIKSPTNFDVYNENDISLVLSSLKVLAEQLNLPIIVTSHIDDKIESREGSKKPLLQDLGILASLSDKVLCLYRDEYYSYEEDERGNPTKNIAEIICCKNTNGNLGSVYMNFNKGVFDDLADNYTTNADIASSTPLYFVPPASGTDGR